MTEVRDALELGIACKIEGRYQAAREEISKFLAEYPGHAEAHHQQGLVYGFIGMFDESLAELELAVNLDPENTLARNDLALTYTMLGLYDQAKEEFARVLDKDRENNTAKRNLTYFG